MRKLLFLIILWAQVAYGTQKVCPFPEAWPPQVVRWHLEGGKELIFVATHNVDNLGSAMHQHLKKIFQEEKPDICVMEGFCSDCEGISPDRLKKKSTETCEKMGKCGENLYASYLATLHNIPFKGAEICEKAQMALLKECGYTREDVIFYLLAQHLPYFYRDGGFKSHREKFTPVTWEPMCNNFLQETISGWIGEEVGLTYQDFLVWWQKHFNTPLDMEKEFAVWERGVLYCDPGQDENALHTQKIAFRFHKNRDNYLFEVIQNVVKHNTKTLVVYTTYHLRELWNQLTQAFGKPSSVMAEEEKEAN